MSNYKLPNTLTHFDISDNCLKVVDLGPSTKNILCKIFLKNNYIN